MIGTLNGLLDLVETERADDLDVAAWAQANGTTEYHLRRMFSSLAGMPLSEYVRRRRMTLAAADLTATDDDLLTVAVRYGYGSTEAFGRAFRATHGVGPSDVRRDGGPLRTQPVLRFRLSVEGSAPMDVTITQRPALTLVGHAVEVPLQHRGLNPAIQQHIASLPMEAHLRLKELSDTDPAGILAVTLQEQPDASEGSPVTYLHGVAVEVGEVPAELDTIPADAGAWAVFHSDGPHPQALQYLWAATATEWFPSNPWRLRPGPSLLRYLALTEDRATCELWLPVERA